jgi:hypothetical protein
VSEVDTSKMVGSATRHSYRIKRLSFSPDQKEH